MTEAESQQLAQLNEDLVNHDDPTQYLTFSVLGRKMAIGILDVEEIIEVSDITRVPMSQQSIRGVINLRGNVVPVIDLAVRLGEEKQAMQLTPRTSIVLVATQAAGENLIMGMLVDEVNEILEIPEDAIQKTPDFGTDINARFIRQMGRVQDDFVVLLNLESVLSTEELAMHTKDNGEAFRLQ